MQAAARAEAQAVQGDRAAAAADLVRLPLIRRIVDEALRMYPPAAFQSRTAQADDTLCGQQVRPGGTVILPVYALHWHHLVWPDRDWFDPTRFARIPGKEPKPVMILTLRPEGVVWLSVTRPRW